MGSHIHYIFIIPVFIADVTVTEDVCYYYANDRKTSSASYVTLWHRATVFHHLYQPGMIFFPGTHWIRCLYYFCVDIIVCSRHNTSNLIYAVIESLLLTGEFKNVVSLHMVPSNWGIHQSVFLIKCAGDIFVWFALYVCWISVWFALYVFKLTSVLVMAKNTVP